MKKNILLLATLLLLCSISFAQKTITTYYDYQHTEKHEVYTANNYGVKNGLYTEYSEYGGILSQGTYKNDEKTGKWIYKDEKGKLYLEENYDNNGKYDGQVIKYENGYKNRLENYKHGEKNGNWKTWYSADDYGNADMNGDKIFLTKDGKTQLQCDEYYRNGMLDSVYTEYYSNGKISKQIHYQAVLTDNVRDSLIGKGVNLNNGVLNGEDKEYNEQGALISNINYVNGVKEGEAIFYDEDGSGEVMAQGKYKNGQNVGEWRFTYDENFQETYKKSKAAYYRIINVVGDKWKATDYYITGEKQGEETFIQMVPKEIYVGLVTCYYKNGHISLKQNFNDKGIADGMFISYYENGAVNTQIKYVDGNLDSTFTTYYDNGKIFVQGTCKDNRRIGIWNIWDKNGNLIFMEGFMGSANPAYGRRHFYKNGQEIQNTHYYMGGENQIVTDDMTYSNQWPWPDAGLINELKEYTQ